MSKRFANPETPLGPGPLRVAVFCGGRGATSILQALLRTSGIQLTVLVNAYDDGLSTGRLRGFVPGMLGASDFRKNLSRLLVMSSPVQFAVADLLEYRFPPGVAAHALGPLVEAFAARAADRRVTEPHGVLPASLLALMQAIDAQTASVFHEQLAAFANYARACPEPFSFEDCALGNLLLAGAYVANERSFNRAVTHLARALHCRANVVNVTTGENRILVALKTDGEILEREARIVGPQSAVPIRALYLLPEMISEATLQTLEPLDSDRRAGLLASWHRDVELSPEARSAIETAEILIYGPGTQHSSLLPSYMTRGIADAIASSASRHRVFVVNAADDHETQGLRPVDLVQNALVTLGDPRNARRLITDILVPVSRMESSGFETADYLGAKVVRDTLTNPALPGVHNGTRVVESIRALADSRDEGEDAHLDIYVDLHRRSVATEALVQEFVEVSWAPRFSHVHLRVNNAQITPAALPRHLTIEAAVQDGLFSEIPVLLEWLRTGRSRFLASLTGDGEYRLQDIELACDLLRARRFGALFGARNQSKEQFFGSLRDAYAGRKVMYAASVAGGFAVSALCGVRLGLILSDPLTGFRVYDRRALPSRLCESLLGRPPRTTLEITRRLVAHGVELAEIPVYYHYYPGFTDERWRLKRGLINMLSVLR